MTITTLQKHKLNEETSEAFQICQIGNIIESLQSGEGSALTPAVAGVAEASKLLLLGATKNVDTLDITAGGLKLGAVAVTSSAAELNLLDGVTASTAELNIVDGVTKTASEINALVGAPAGGYKLARGVATVGAASETVVTGLATVVSVVVSLVGDPSATHMWSTATPGDQAGSPAAGSFTLKSWTYTAADNVAPIPANTVFANVAWIAIGT